MHLTLILDSPSQEACAVPSDALLDPLPAQELPLPLLPAAPTSKVQPPAEGSPGP